MIKLCQVCSTPSTACCSRCKSVYYCGPEHQKSDWKQHKSACNAALLAGKQQAAKEKVETMAKMQAELLKKRKELEDSIAQMRAEAEKMQLEAEQCRSDLNEWQQKKEEAGKTVDNAACMLFDGTKLKEKVQVVADQLNSRGFAFFDDFVSEDLANDVLVELNGLYERGEMQMSELAGGKKGDGLKYILPKIRGDLNAFISGEEENCKRIGHLLDELDKTCQLLLTTVDELKGVELQRGRTMIACYPGNGSRYIRHCDNPDKNGRKITVILYMNKGWKPGDGGELKIEPVNAAEPTIIPPLFNRLLVFFSDRRNPHEVLPSYIRRFAVTTWYFDAEERQRAISSISEVECEQRRVELEIEKFEREFGEKAIKVFSPPNSPPMSPPPLNKNEPRDLISATNNNNTNNNPEFEDLEALD